MESQPKSWIVQQSVEGEHVASLFHRCPLLPQQSLVSQCNSKIMNDVFPVCLPWLSDSTFSLYQPPASSKSSFYPRAPPYSILLTLSLQSSWIFIVKHCLPLSSSAIMSLCNHNAYFSTSDSCYISLNLSMSHKHRMPTKTTFEHSFPNPKSCFTTARDPSCNMTDAYVLLLLWNLIKWGYGLNCCSDFCFSSLTLKQGVDDKFPLCWGIFPP